MEIGSGYGALSSCLKGNYSKFIIVDLIENLILASEFLNESGINFGTISDLSNNNVSVLLLSGGDMRSVDKVDIVVNTMSMQHMTNENLNYYFGEIERLHPKYIYLVNRNIKRDLTDVEIQNYPIPSRYTPKKSNPIYSKNYTEILLACTDCASV
jgi:cyclopropane fatty-acyl-phospholipid synthase-like methyltransferase